MYKRVCAFLGKGHEILLNAYFVKNGRPFATDENNLPVAVAVQSGSTSW